MNVSVHVQNRLRFESYAGLPIRCAPGVHKAALELIEKHAAAARSSRIVDLAAGSGAFVARLCEAGFSNVDAVELDNEKFGYRRISAFPCDLNSQFAEQMASVFQKFDVISAIEVIEHLNSPTDFLANVNRIAAPGALLVVTTPNSADLVGRMKFLLSGELRYFDLAQYRHNHHVSPIPDAIMRALLDDAGFTLLEHATAGSFRSSAATRLLYVLSALARPVLRSLQSGEVNIYAARRDRDVRVSRAGDWLSA